MNKGKNKTFHFNWLIFAIYAIGVFVEVILKLTATSGSGDSLSNLIVMAVFFLIILLIFAMAANLFKKGSRMKEELDNASLSLQKPGKCESLTADDLDNFFRDESLVSAMKEFKKENAIRRNMSKETCADIRDHINYEMLEKAIHTHYLDQISNIMTALGILGTFLGLSIGLNSFDLSGTATDVEKKIQPLMEGIKVAFHTSICGIFYSVLFNLTYRRFYAGVEASVENFVDVFSENVITSVNNGSTMTQISYQDKIARSMVYQSKILERIDEHMTGAFVQQLTETLGKISDMAIDLTKVNQGLESSVSHFDQFTDKMEKYQRMVNASIENMSDQIQVQNDKMQNYIELFGKSLRTSEDMNNKMYQQLEFVDKTLANSKNINEGLSETAEKLNIQLEHIDQISRASQEYFKTSLEAIKESSMKEIQTFSKQTKADIKMVSDTSKKEMEVIKQMSQENIEKIGQAAEQKIEQITVVKRTTSQDIQKVSDSLVDNIEKLTQSMEQKGKAVVDEYYTELNNNIKSFASNIRSMKNATTQMEKIAKEIPVFMLDTKGNIETQFSEMQIKLDQYLEYADKLHSDIANRWELLRTQEEN